MSADALEFINLPPEPEDEATPRCVVRIKTAYWHSPRGIHMRKDITYLRRLCSGFNILEEDAANIGADVWENIDHKLDELTDGIYEVTTCNHSHCTETGYLDAWDLRFTRIEFHGPPLWMFLRFGKPSASNALLPPPEPQPESDNAQT